MQILQEGKLSQKLLFWVGRIVECDRCEFKAKLEGKDAPLIHKTRRGMTSHPEYRMYCPACGQDMFLSSGGVL